MFIYYNSYKFLTPWNTILVIILSILPGTIISLQSISNQNSQSATYFRHKLITLEQQFSTGVPGRVPRHAAGVGGRSKRSENENNNSLIKISYYSKIPRTSIPNVPDPKITLQCTFNTPPFTLVKPLVSVSSQLLFGLGVLFPFEFALMHFCYL
jgi:hypothetical protein